MTTERDLIQRLLVLSRMAVDAALEYDYGDPEDHHIYRELQELDSLAAAYLATPEPAAGPTNDDLLHVFYLHCDSNVSYLGAEHWLDDQAFLIAARDALQSWGHQPPQPIPLSERLPGAEDCDAEGRCWFWADQLSDSDEEWGWKLLDRTHGINWSGGPWLPHHALPVPEMNSPAD